MKLLNPWRTYGGGEISGDYSDRTDLNRLRKAFVIKSYDGNFIWSVDISNLPCSRGKENSMKAAQSAADEMLIENGWKFLDERLTVLI